MIWWSVSVAWSSPWVEAPGTVSLGVNVSSLSAQQQFAGGEAQGLIGPLCPEPIFGGQRMPFSCVNGGRFTQRQATLLTTVGLPGSVAVDVQLPVVSATFEDDIGETVALGLGDMRVTLRAGRQWGRGVIAATLLTQIPTGPGNFQDRDVPLGTGQFDIVPGVRWGFGDAWGWVEVWQSFAIRLRNPTTGVNLGDEWRPAALIGWTPWPTLGALGRVDALVALPDVDSFGIRIPGRSLLQARVAGFARPRSARAWFEVGVAVPLAGRRWPAAVQPYATVLTWLNR
ncbi:MAG: hypothetical protein AAGA48_25160 [Myxococcota bacterium]